MTFSLGCSERCLDGELRDKLSLLEKLGLWLELTNTELRDLSILDSYDVEVKTVQAYLLHELHWLSSERSMRKAAFEHVLDSIKLAEEVGIEYVLTVPTYGFDIMVNPREECVANYRKISKDTHLDILIEALSPNQTEFLPTLTEVAGLIAEIDRDNIGLAADTWHIKESTVDVADTLNELDTEVVEIHLRDTDSKPPGNGTMDFKKILGASSPRLMCLEFSTGPKENLMEAIAHLRSSGLDI